MATVSFMVNCIVGSDIAGAVTTTFTTTAVVWMLMMMIVVMMESLFLPQILIDGYFCREI